MDCNRAPSLTIAVATEAEREWAASLMAGSEPWVTLGRSLEQCRKACRHPEHVLYIAHTAGQPCGILLLDPRGAAGSPYIASVAVAEEFRNQGIGRQMLEFAETLFRGQARHIFLCVSSFNQRARALYERCGYSAVGELKDYIIAGASEILMHKRLRQS